MIKGLPRRKSKTRWQRRLKRGEAPKIVKKILMENCLSGLTIKEICQRTGLKYHTVYSVLNRQKGLNFPRENEHEPHVYYHPICERIIEVLENALEELNEHFVESTRAGPTMVIGPRFKGMISYKILASKLIEKLKGRGVMIPKDMLIEIIKNDRGVINEKAKSKGLRIRVGPVSYPRWIW